MGVRVGWRVPASSEHLQEALSVPGLASMPAHLLLQQRQLPLSVCIQLRALELSWWALIIVLRRWLASQSLILRQSGVPLVALVLVLWRLVSQALVIRQSGVLAGAFILMDDSRRRWL